MPAAAPTQPVQPINSSLTTHSIDPRQYRRIARALQRSSFAVLATVSDQGFPHAAGVVHVAVDGRLYVHTMRSSRKARNIASNARVAVVVPVRKLPAGPPFTIQFQATAQLLAMDDTKIAELIEGGRLAAISGHGALDEPDGCFVEITPSNTIHTYGFGVSPIALMRDPLHVGADAIRVADLTSTG